MLSKCLGVSVDEEDEMNAGYWQCSTTLVPFPGSPAIAWEWDWCHATHSLNYTIAVFCVGGCSKLRNTWEMVEMTKTHHCPDTWHLPSLAEPDSHEKPAFCMRVWLLRVTLACDCPHLKSTVCVQLLSWDLRKLCVVGNHQNITASLIPRPHERRKLAWEWG